MQGVAAFTDNSLEAKGVPKGKRRHASGDSLLPAQMNGLRHVKNITQSVKNKIIIKQNSSNDDKINSKNYENNNGYKVHVVAVGILKEVAVVQVALQILPLEK